MAAGACRPPRAGELALLHKTAPEVIRHEREKDPDRFRLNTSTSLAEADADLERWRDIRSLIEDIPSLAPDAELPGATIFAVGLFLGQLVGRTTDSMIISFDDGRSVDLDDIGLDRDPWPAQALPDFVNGLCSEIGLGPDQFLGAAIEKALEREAIVEGGRAALLAEIEALRRQRILADAAELDKVSRYEASLERSMIRTLHELLRLQAARNGGISAPLALDVDFAAF